MKVITNHFLSVEQVSHLFGVTEQTVRSWAINGVLPAHKNGKSWYFPKSKIHELQGLQDTYSIFGSDSKVYRGSEFDVLIGQSKIEVKTAPLRTVKNKTFTYKRWFFRLNGERKSDYYLLFGYNEDRSKLLKVFMIPTKIIYRLVGKKKETDIDWKTGNRVEMGLVPMDQITIILDSNIYKRFELDRFVSPIASIVCDSCGNNLEIMEDQEDLKKMLKTGICWNCQIKKDQKNIAETKI